MKTTFIAMLITFCYQTALFAQLTVSVSGPNNAPNVCTRQLVATASGGSGSYSYTWGVTNSCAPANNTSQTLNVSCLNNSTAYVFVIDNVTNAIAVSSNVSVSKVLKGSFSVFIPNVFTPNGDGINDTWLITDGSHSTGAINAYASHVEIRDPVHSTLYVYNQNFNPTTGPGLLGGYASYDGAGWSNGTIFAYYVTLQNCDTFQDYTGNITLIK